MREAVLEAAERVLGAVDATEVAQFVALKNPEEGPLAKKRKQTKEEEKAAIVSALAARARVLKAPPPATAEVCLDFFRIPLIFLLRSAT